MSLKPLLELLADGEFHSGEAVGQACAISRAAVWKQVQRLLDMGLDVHSVRGKGYKLARPLHLLDESAIQPWLSAEATERLQCLELFLQVDSTNTYLLNKVEQHGAVQGYHVCSAEQQTQGRGRRGRHWVSPFARNLYLSFATQVDGGFAALEGLSLVVGLSVLETLVNMGVEGAGLKWPNDILVDGRKLAGVLVELSGEASGPCNVVVGVGLNGDMSDMHTGIDQPWVDLIQLIGAVDRNRLMGLLVSSLIDAMEQFKQHGFAPFRARWNQANAHQNGKVSLLMPGKPPIEGVCQGVDGSGHLLLKVAGEVHAYNSGEISLRAL